jgi:HTH-type transcriptional regulator/antitoxin HigA
MTAADLTEYQSLLVDVTPRPIRSEREYRRALRQLENLMKPHPSRAESQIIELLSTLVEQYEATKYPTPARPPREMLAHYLENRGMTAAELSRQTGIARSAVANILAGRRSLSKRNAVKLAECFGVPVGVFIEASL